MCGGGGIGTIFGPALESIFFFVFLCVSSSSSFFFFLGGGGGGTVPSPRPTSYARNTRQHSNSDGRLCHDDYAYTLLSCHSITLNFQFLYYCHPLIGFDYEYRLKAITTISLLFSGIFFYCTCTCIIERQI